MCGFHEREIDLSLSLEKLNSLGSLNFEYIIITTEAFLFDIVLASLYFTSPLIIYNNKHFFSNSWSQIIILSNTIYLPLIF